jgi:hypothetical protein
LSADSHGGHEKSFQRSRVKERRANNRVE